MNISNDSWIDNYNDFDSFEGGWTYLHEAAKIGNFDIIHFMLSDTDIDPNMVGRGEINISKEESKTCEFDNGINPGW